MDKISRVLRTKEQAKRAYDRMSRVYDLVAGPFERKFATMALDRLNVQEGERVLEIGFGTGRCLAEIAKRVGERGKAYGVDISTGMVEVTRKRLERAGLLDRVELYCGDAVTIPYGDKMFDAVFMSFTLELFDTPEIPVALEEIKRVLKSKRRLGVVSLSKENGDSRLMRVYEWFHNKFPALADCRPIFVEQSIKEAGFEIGHNEKISIFGLPGEIVIGVIIR